LIIRKAVPKGIPPAGSEKPKKTQLKADEVKDALWVSKESESL